MLSKRTALTLILLIGTGIALTPNDSLAARTMSSPSPLSAAPTPANQMMVQLNWVDVPGETGFILERRSSTAASFAEVAKIGQDVKTYKDVTTASQNYEYRLRAYKVRGGQIYYSQYTNTVSVQTGTTAGTTSTTTGTTDTTTTGTTTGTTDTTTTGTTTGTTDTTTTGTTNDPC